MRLTDILSPDCIKVPLEAADKQQAIFQLVDLLAARTGISNAEELKAAVWQREQTRTTGIGHGVAIPHGKSKGCARLHMGIARLATPIDFKAIDGKPVELIFLLASPEDQTRPHILALAAVSKMLADTEFRAALKKAATADDLYRMIVQHEGAQMA